MTAVVDASVALKWYIDESDAALAEAVLARSSALIAPELIVVEVANAAWKAFRRGEIGATQQAWIAEDITSVLDQLTALRPLSARASAIAREIEHPVYDCFYLALSEAENSLLITADGRLLAKVAQTAFAARTVHLRDFAGRSR